MTSSLFRTPKTSIGNLEAEVAANLIAAAADIALVIDADGVVRDVAYGSEELARPEAESWIGQRFIDTVTIESRPKVEELLTAARGNAPRRWRQVNHPMDGGVDLPVRYSAVQAGQDGNVIAVGRDLRNVAALQQRLVAAQQAMEREYVRLRHAETRYRLLFQIASEAVLVVDAGTQRVTEANPAAATLLGASAKRLIGRGFAELFDDDGQEAVRGLLADVRASGRAEEVEARQAEGGTEFTVSASIFRQDKGAHFLVRLAPVRAAEVVNPTGGPRSKLLKVIEGLPDGFVVIGPDRRILTTNSAFLDLAQLATERQARDEPLDRWLGRPGVDLDLLMTSLREHGSVRQFTTIVRGEYGSVEEVEVSAVAVQDADQPSFGFTIRSVGRRPKEVAAGSKQLPRSIEQLSQVVGRVSLKDLVQETTELIERLSIEAALDMTGDNRASAAELLGLSRQSLYVKLRRYGIGDLGSDSDDG